MEVEARHVEITAGICGGRPRIAGRRIRVQDIVIWHEQWGLTPEEIVSQFPQLSLSDVYAALAYYHDHQDDIRRHIREDEALVADFQRHNPSRLLRKLGALR